MPRNPGADNDGVRPYIRQREKARGLGIRPRAHTETKTILVGAALIDGMDVPEFIAGVNADDHAPEWKYLHSVRSKVSVGSCTIEWLVNGSTVATQSLTTTTAVDAVDPVVELAHGDRITVLISDASVDASGLSAGAVMVTSPS